MVKLLKIDEKGKLVLSRKALLQKPEREEKKEVKEETSEEVKDTPVEETTEKEEQTEAPKPKRTYKRKKSTEE